MRLSEIVERVLAFDCLLVEITGGEPLLQKNVLPLMKELCDRQKTLLIETSGAHDISQIDPRVHRIMDLKKTILRTILFGLLTEAERIAKRAGRHVPVFHRPTPHE